MSDRDQSHFNRQPLQPSYGFVHVRSALVMFSFASVVFTATEGAEATIEVTRTGTAAASVSYAATAGTATAITDFLPVSGVLSWAEGDTAPKTFTIATVDNDIDAPANTVLLALSEPTAGVLGPVANAVLVIVGNDGGGPVIPPPPGFCDGALFCDLFNDTGSISLLAHTPDVGLAYNDPDGTFVTDPPLLVESGSLKVRAVPLVDLRYAGNTTALPATDVAIEWGMRFFDTPANQTGQFASLILHNEDNFVPYAFNGPPVDSIILVDYYPNYYDYVAGTYTRATPGVEVFFGGDAGVGSEYRLYDGFGIEFGREYIFRIEYIAGTSNLYIDGALACQGVGARQFKGPNGMSKLGIEIDDPNGYRLIELTKIKAESLTSPEIFWSDTFTDTNGTLLTAHAPEIGTSYQLDDLNSNFLKIGVADGTARVVSGSAAVTNAELFLDLPPTDFYIDVDFLITGDAANENGYMLNFVRTSRGFDRSHFVNPRFVNFESNYYFQITRRSSTGLPFIQFFANSRIFYYPDPFSFNTVHRFRAEHRGTALYMYLDGQFMAVNPNFGYMTGDRLMLNWDGGSAADPRNQVSRVEMGILPGKVRLSPIPFMEAEDLSVNRSDYAYSYEVDYLDIRGSYFNENGNSPEVTSSQINLDWTNVGLSFGYAADSRASFQTALPSFNFTSPPAGVPSDKILLISNDYSETLTPIPKPVIMVDGVVIPYDYTAITGDDIANVYLRWDGVSASIVKSYRVFRETPGFTF